MDAVTKETLQTYASISLTLWNSNSNYRDKVGPRKILPRLRRMNNIRKIFDNIVGIV
jgi:hypothetical protein